MSHRHERMDNNIHPSGRLDPIPESDHPAAENVEIDRIAPCLERLQRLEASFSKLSSKPAVIPIEKEQVLQESWDRIKSIEYDLEKTKKVSSAI